MSSGNSPDPKTPDWREQRKIEIRRQLEDITQEVAEKEAARNFRPAGGPTTDPHTEEEVNLRRWLKARKQEELHLLTELAELVGVSRASITQRLNGSSSREQGQASLDPPRQSPQRDASDSVASSPEGRVSTVGKAIHHAIVPETDSGLDADDEFDTNPGESDKINISDEDEEVAAPDKPSATALRTRYISKKDMEEQGLWGVGIYKTLYQSEATDALYFLSDLGEEIWLTNENGDCVLAQD